MIYALMVGRNESSRYLKEVLERLSNQVDKIIFTDDCSTDDTPDVARQYATVYSTSENLFIKDESQLRSEAWANLEKHAKVGDWVLAIDADEKLYTMDNLSLLDHLKQSPYDVVSAPRFEMWNQFSFRSDGGWKPHHNHRIFKFDKNGVYINKKLACGSEPMYVQRWAEMGNWWLQSGIIIQHLGYLRDQDKNDKYERYMKLDGGKYHNINHLNSIKQTSTLELESWKILGDLK